MEEDNEMYLQVYEQILQTTPMTDIDSEIAHLHKILSPQAIISQSVDHVI